MKSISNMVYSTNFFFCLPAWRAHKDATHGVE